MVSYRGSIRFRELGLRVGGSLHQGPLFGNQALMPENLLQKKWNMKWRLGIDLVYTLNPKP